MSLARMKYSVAAVLVAAASHLVSVTLMPGEPDLQIFLADNSDDLARGLERQGFTSVPMKWAGQTDDSGDTYLFFGTSSTKPPKRAPSSLRSVTTRVRARSQLGGRRVDHVVQSAGIRILRAGDDGDHVKGEHFPRENLHNAAYKTVVGSTNVSLRGGADACRVWTGPWEERGDGVVR
ncbi:hypothetical protein F4810DRAFT_705921 [Camillea tinctor]|nr:hypothetical protein F4810DRAFT_705921 [Camillea tinctor]